MSELQFHQFPCLEDNYAVLVHASASGETALIDTPDAGEILKQLAVKGWRLTHIFNTHHHGDHTSGNLTLKAETGAMIIGPDAEADRIPGIDVAVKEGHPLTFAGHAVSVLETPGHTIGHVSYHLPDAKTAFTGDTLFALGCGRVFEGTPEMMWHSLEKLKKLPAETRIYCGHEYTAANLKFALTVEPENAALQVRAAEIGALRSQNLPTLPTTLGLEFATNPFLRTSEPAIRKHVGLEWQPEWKVFAELRQLKNKA